jgi:hypothetical protein
MNQQVVLTVSPLGDRVTADFGGTSKFWVELVHQDLHLFAWGVNVDGSTIYHAELGAGPDMDAVDVAYDVLMEVLLREDGRFSAAVVRWADAEGFALERVQAFCGGAR